MLAASSAFAQTTYTWANSNVTDNATGTTLNWFDPTQGAWNGGTPVSDNLNTIQFFEDTTTPLTYSDTYGQNSVIDNGGSAFQLGTLTLSGLGSATAAANRTLTMTISGDALNFSAATGTINLDALNNGNRRIVYDLNSDIQLGTASSAGALTITGNGNHIFKISGEISELQAGGGSLIKSGTSTVILDAISDSFTGNVVVSGGLLQIGDNNTSARLGGATYAGDIALDGGNIRFTNNQTQELSGIISGTGSLDKGGSGILTLSGANTYTGQTKILGSGAGGPGLSISSFNSVFTNEELGTVHSASSSIGAPTTVSDGTIEFGNSGNQRSSTLIYTGDGETTDRVMSIGFNAGSSHQLHSSGTGLLKFTSAFEIKPSSGNTVSGLTLMGDGDGEIAAGFVDAPVSGGSIPGRLDKDGAGTWTIGGTTTANSTTVKAGTLIINGILDVTTTVTVDSGATLGGSATINGAITVNGTLSVGNSPGQMIVNDSLTLGATSNTLMELGGTTLGVSFDNITLDAAAALVYGGNLIVENFGAHDMDAAGFTYELFTLNGVTPTGDFATVTVNSILLDNSGGVWTGSNGGVDYVFNQTSGSLSVIPEPSAALLAGLGMLGLLRRRR